MNRTTWTFFSFIFLGFVIAVGSQSNAQDSPKRSDPVPSRPLEGRLGIPLNTPVVLEGVVTEGPYKGFEDGPNIVVQKIDGRATQRFIRIRLTAQNTDIASRRIKWKIGRSYQFRGQEDGGFIGGERSNDGSGIPLQTYGGPTFIPYFEVLEDSEIETYQFKPGDFLDRKSMFQGTALNVRISWETAGFWQFQMSWHGQRI